MNKDYAAALVAKMKAADKAAEIAELNKRFGSLLRRVPATMQLNADGTQVYGHRQGNRMVYLTVKQGKIQEVLEA